MQKPCVSCVAQVVSAVKVGQPKQKNLGLFPSLQSSKETAQYWKVNYYATLKYLKDAGLKNLLYLHLTHLENDQIFS